MAIEVELQWYKFEPRPSRKPDHQKSRERLPTPFRYNPLHDLESIWWIAAWFLFKRTVAFDDDETDDPAEVARRKEQDKEAEELFVSNRHTILSFERWCRFPHLWTCLHPSVQPIGAKLEVLRKELAETYRPVKQDNSGPQAITNTVADALHVKFRRAFGDIVAGLRKEAVEMWPIRVNLNPGRKQPREYIEPSEERYRRALLRERLEPLSPRITRAKAAALANASTSEQTSTWSMSPSV